MGFLTSQHLPTSRGLILFGKNIISTSDVAKFGLIVYLASYVELHKKEPDNDIWGIDYSSIPKPNYDSSSDEDKEYNHEYINFMNK